jgi:acetyl esterase
MIIRDDVNQFLIERRKGTQAGGVIDVVTARQDLREFTKMSDGPRGNIARVRNFEVYGASEVALGARLYDDRSVIDAAPLLIFFHGGGWFLGDLETHDALCAEIARTLRIPVLAINYRLAPEHPFPAPVEDALAAVRWASQSPVEIGYPITGIVLAGDSAGGTLAAVCAQELSNALPIPLLAQFLMYPSTDLTATTGSIQEFGDGFVPSHAARIFAINSYTPIESDRKDPKASPLLAKNFQGLPPTVLLTCELDPMRDEGREYVRLLQKSGVKVIHHEAEGQIHGCCAMRQIIPSAQDDLELCLSDLSMLIGGES